MKYITKELYQNMQIYNLFQFLNDMYDEFIGNVSEIYIKLGIDKNSYNEYENHINFTREKLNTIILDNLKFDNCGHNKFNCNLYNKSVKLNKDYDYELNIALNSIETNTDIIKKGDYSNNIKKLADFDMSNLTITTIIPYGDKTQFVFENMILEFYNVDKLDIIDVKNLPVQVFYTELVLHNNKFEYNILFCEGELSIVFYDVNFI